jgi:hypothetical protein
MKRLLTVFLLILLAIFAFTANASADTMPWLGMSGATAYRQSLQPLHEPIIYAQSLNTLELRPLGVANGEVSANASATSSNGIALTVTKDAKLTLVLFRKNQRSARVASTTFSECPPLSGAETIPDGVQLRPIDLRPDGTLTYMTRSASTGCAARLVRRSPTGREHFVWMPLNMGVIGSLRIDVEGDLVYWASGQADTSSAVFNSRTKRVFYMLPKSLGGLDSLARLATSGTLGIPAPNGSTSGAVSVNLKSGLATHLAFPYLAAPVFCGRSTFFGANNLTKVYDATGHTLYRHATPGVRVHGFESMCSPKYVLYRGSGAYAEHEYLLSLTTFKLRKIS